jgi:proline dehydrogenase
MLLVSRLFKRQAFRVGVKPFYSHPVSTASGNSTRTLLRRPASRPSRILLISAASGGAVTATLMLCWGYSLYADVPSLKENEPTPTPISNHLTSYIVYSACSIPGLVEASSALLALCTSIPGLRQLTEAFVRVTFFKQVFFCLPIRSRDRGC